MPLLILTLSFGRYSAMECSVGRDGHLGEKAGQRNLGRRKLGVHL